MASMKFLYENKLQNSDLNLGRNDAKYFSAVLLFIPLIFHRLFVGEIGGLYGGIGLSFVGYVSHALLVISPILTNKKSSAGISIYFLILLFIVSIFQLYNSMNIFHFDNNGLLITAFRALLWITAIYVYCVHYYDPNFLLKAFLDVLTFAALVAMLCYMVYFTTDIPLGVNIDRNVGRLQGMFSEPSALSASYPGYILVNFHLRNYKRLMLGVIFVLLSFSIICLATTVVAITIYLIYRQRRLFSAISYSATALIVLITFSAGSGIQGGAYRLSESLKSFVDLFWADGPIRQNTVDRVIEALAALSAYVTSGQQLEVSESGSLARILGSFFLIENMQRDGTTWIGYGLSNYGSIAEQLYGTVLDFGFFPYLVSSFGAAAGVAAIFLHLRKILAWNGTNDALFFVFICSFFGTIYNSAGGITTYTLPVLGLVAGYAETKRRNRMSSRNTAVYLKT